jgi:hypothetical protein
MAFSTPAINWGAISSSISASPERVIYSLDHPLRRPPHIGLKFEARKWHPFSCPIPFPLLKFIKRGDPAAKPGSKRAVAAEEFVEMVRAY